ncbi:hypothetical protein D5R81_10855 [Parashewanella spongiae]|uniref:Uncharacterized protein n=1 Tax=Parashewanella spongiae TaxID=342950 RepID=A0A3A6U0Z0_9GAMM|nr:hypothetical protein [Parashewanella spongiae]MCL1078508.1 hypothetical protein [Parashewanella spongiae]RJY14699.1 hypothetical protein D5R81_10855 [Parashewanella spongiae]
MAVSSTKIIKSDTYLQDPTPRKVQSWELSYNKTYDVSSDSDSDSDVPPTLDFLSQAVTASACSQQERDLLMRLDQPNFGRRVEALHCTDCFSKHFCSKHKPQTLPLDEYQAHKETQDQCIQDIIEIQHELTEAKSKQKPCRNLEKALFHARNAKEKFNQDFKSRLQN